MTKDSPNIEWSLERTQRRRGICLFSGGKQRVVLRFCNDLYFKNCGTISIEALLDQTSLKNASLSATPYKII